MSTDSGCQLWITSENGEDKVRLPVLPEKIEVTTGKSTSSVTIIGLGEVTIPQDRTCMVFSFSCFFPAHWFRGCNYREILTPMEYVRKLMEFKNSKKPVKLVIAGTDIDLYCTIETFKLNESGGDVDTINYSIEFKEYRSVAPRQIDVSTLPDGSNIVGFTNPGTRPDNTTTPRTYTVKKGDTLKKIAKKVLKKKSRWKEIYELNKDVITNKYVVKKGMILVLPE